MNARMAALGFLLCVATVPVGAGEPELLALRVSPAVSFAPANLVVRATIATHAENRIVEIIAESQDFYRSSEVQLDGDRAPRTTQFEFRSLPPGTYEVKAILRGSSGERAQVTRQVNVISSAGADR